MQDEDDYPLMKTEPDSESDSESGIYPPPGTMEDESSLDEMGKFKLFCNISLNSNTNLLNYFLSECVCISPPRWSNG